MQFQKLHLKVKVEVGLKFEIACLTQHLGLSIFDPNLGSNNLIHSSGNLSFIYFLISDASQLLCSIVYA